MFHTPKVGVDSASENPFAAQRCVAQKTTGAYLLPDTGPCREALAAVERDILAINGTAYLLPIHHPDDERFIELFDRSDDYIKRGTEIEECQAQLNADNALATTKQIRRLRKSYAQLASIDFFPGTPRQQVDSVLLALDTAVSRALSADEPGHRDASATVEGNGWGGGAIKVDDTSND